jgi:hypothetical protein
LTDLEKSRLRREAYARMKTERPAEWEEFKRKAREAYHRPRRYRAE